MCFLGGCGARRHYLDWPVCHLHLSAIQPWLSDKGSLSEGSFYTNSDVLRDAVKYIAFHMQIRWLATLSHALVRWIRVQMVKPRVQFLRRVS